MGDLDPSLRALAAQLAGGPAFLVLGQGGEQALATDATAFPWSGVYTTATDRSIADAFASDRRVSSSHGAMGRAPSRSQSDLEVRYLFGAPHLPEPDRPATTSVEEARSRLRSLQELTRLVTETVTPRGTIVVEGWAPGDRLDVRDLAPTLGLLGLGQAHLFSATAWVDDPHIIDLAASGLLVLHAGSLEDAIVALAAAGAIAVGADRTGALGQHVIALGNGFVDVDVHTWNQIRRSARPIDLELLTPPVFSSDAARYQEFRNFAGATEGVPRWRGIAAKMYLRRDFEAAVLRQVRLEFESRALPTPIVLAGQTATGKSIALASLAAELSRSGEFAVLHQSRRTVRPALEDIDMYAAWAEERGARGTILFWDGMVDPGDYEAMSRQLHARGRRVLVVGSAYKTESATSIVITAKVDLSERETTGLVDLLGSFGVEVTKPKRALDSSFLAFLYHTLPETEHALRSGLASEMRAAERSMAKLARERGPELSGAQRVTAMAEALAAAGFKFDLLPSVESEVPLAEQAFAERAPIQRVTTLVLVAGRHGVPVPMDLALRILGREGSQSVRDALNTSDIIREIDDDNGDFFLAARSHLEAELLSLHEVPLEVEIEVIVEAIQSVRVLDGFSGGADEVQFLVSLLERIGPTAEQPRYKRYFGEIAEALRYRREELGRPRPRLVLQESHFTRGSVHWQQEVKEGSTQDRVASLEHNRELLEDVLSDSTTRGLMRLSLAVELASTLGAIIHEFSRDPEVTPIGGLGGRLDDVLRAVLDARSVDPGNVYPVDVLAWSTRDAIETGALTPGERVDRLANAVAALESLDRGALSERQLANVDRRGAELNKLLRDDDAVWEYLGKLELNTDPAATYFLAQFDAKDGEEGESKALKRLRGAPHSTRTDWRCAQLLLDLTWKEITGGRLLQGERSALYLSEGDVTRIRALARDLEAAQLPDIYRLRFVQAIAEFSDGRFAEASRTFREVGDLSRQLSRRIYTAYVLADDSRKPRVFTGRVENSDPRSGDVWVNELGTRVKFEPRLFSATGEFARGQQIPAFHIGFKLSRGAVAEPRNMYRDPSRS